MNIEWEDKFSTGDKTFDDQHKKLFFLANQYFGALEKGGDRKILEDIFESLWWYTLSHFKAEEKAMEKAEYPQLEDHRGEHKELMTTVRKYKELLQQGNPVSASEFAEFLKNWLLRHIVESDSKYGPFLKKLED